MNKNKRGKKFGRKRDQRHALLRGLAQSLVLHERIRTTEPKAKELRSYIEKLVTKAKKDTVATRRFVARDFADKKAIQKLVSDIGPRYRDRSGGYTRIIKRAPRRIDAAKRAVIEFV